jgi:hypothetical protein
MEISEEQLLSALSNTSKGSENAEVTNPLFPRLICNNSTP